MSQQGDDSRKGLSFALRLGTELVVATVLGTLMGYALDRMLGTEPWLMALGVVFGGAAGCLNVYRFAMQEMKESEETNNDINNGN